MTGAVLKYLRAELYAGSKTQGKAASRKPSNSSYATCVAFGAGGNTEKVEISEGRDEPLFLLDGQKVEWLAYTAPNCEGSLSDAYNRGCEIRNKLNGKAGSMMLSRGKLRLTASWGRGTINVHEIEPVLDFNGTKLKLFGSCAAYNF